MKNTTCDISTQLTILIVTAILTLIVFLIRDWRAEKKSEEQILKSSKIQLEFFSNTLITSIQNNNKSLATEHYQILLKDIAIIVKDEKLGNIMKKLEEQYFALHVGNFKDENSKEAAMKKLLVIQKSLQ